MDTAATPLTFNNAQHLPAFGLPEDRMARVAARKAFVEMKMSFMRAAAKVEGQTGARLQRKVRATTEVIELWQLRHVMMAALPLSAGSLRKELQLHIESVFPESRPGTGFVSL